MILALLCAAAAITEAPAPLLVADVDIELEGRQETAESSILRMMNTRVGAPLDPEVLAHDLTRLRATLALADVSAEVDDVGDGDGALVIVHLRDRFALLPVFSLRRGGGRTTTRVGMSDRNLFGRILTLQAELQSATSIPFSDLSRIGSLVALVAPRVNGSPLTTALLWRREFLDFSGWDPSGAAAVVYDRTRHSIQAEARLELSDLAMLSLSATGVRDSYGLDGSSPSVAPVPVRGRTGLLAAELVLGLLDDRVTTLEGLELRLRVERAQQGVLSDFSFGTASAFLRWFTLTRGGDNFGLLLSAQTTSARTDSNLLRAGGLTEIRGFPDAYFLGQHLLRANAEYRLQLLRTDILVPMATQAAGFVDLGHVSGRAEAVAGLAYQGPIVSTGAGLRFILLPITRAILRVDLGMGLYPRRTFDVSLGGQQFF